MDVTLAKTFLAVAEAGSFVDAAEQVFVTQSTVSARIKSLEDLVGQQLFERSKAGAVLTVAGQQFHRHALAFVRVWEHARLDVALSDEHEDHLSVGAQLSLWDGFLLPWVGWMRDSLPELAVTARVGLSPGLMDRLIEGTLDMAVVYRPTQRPGLIIEHLFDEELVLVTSGDAEEKAPGKAYILVNWGPEFLADHALAYPELKQPGLFLDLGTLGVNYLLDKKASGYFPIRTALPYVENGSLRLLKRAPRFVYPAYLVYPEDFDPETFARIKQGLSVIVERA
jgi:DNA-binding transcriptional LysR family regulator